MRFLSAIHESLIPAPNRVRFQFANYADFVAGACRITNWAGANAWKVETATDNGGLIAILVDSSWCSGGSLILQGSTNLCPLTGATTIPVAPGGVDPCTPNSPVVTVAVTAPPDQSWARLVTIPPSPAPTAVQTPAAGYPVVWSVEPPLPEGVQMDPATGIITGTPLFGSPTTQRVIKATTRAGTGTATFNTTVQAAANTVIVASAANQTWPHGTAITPYSVPATDSDPTITTFTWSIAPALPAGLSLAAATGVISGTPTTAAPAAPYTLTATDRTGSSGSTTFNITVS